MYEASYTTMKVIERKFNAGLKVTQYELDLFRKAARTNERLHHQYSEIRQKEQEEARKKKEGGAKKERGQKIAQEQARLVRKLGGAPDAAVSSFLSLP